MRTIDGPLDDYEPYQPFDIGTPDGEPEESEENEASDTIKFWETCARLNIPLNKFHSI